MHYYQEKYKKNELVSTCDLDLNIHSNTIEFRSVYYMIYSRNTIPFGVTFIYEIVLNKKNGDFNITYQIINKNSDNTPKNKLTKRKNNFKLLKTLVDEGFYFDGSTKRYWGKKYEKTIIIYFNQIKDDLQKYFTDVYFSNKLYDFKELFNLIVDFHLYKKNIKAHDNVYEMIGEVYPQKKWLKINDNKFLPAILDEYGIKSKYLIKILSSSTNDVKLINIRTLIFICKLFGENYVDYIKQFNWKECSSTFINPPKKTFICKNDVEKKVILRIFKDMNKSKLTVPIITILTYIHQLFNIREFLEKNGFQNLKLDIKKIDDVEYLLDYWILLKKQATSGVVEKYLFPSDFLCEIETPIIVDNKIFFPKILSSNEDFCIEGRIMKNCMGRQFNHGVIQIFMSMTCEKKRINLQYQRGCLNVAFGKANSPVPDEIFGKAIEILSSRMIKYKSMKWKKEQRKIIRNE
ncbi:MAG: hypothetical protein BWX59_02058 [Bacteroidetes bacterium ADurb.Bin028]|jgi:hypothetical protein|nr:MAG: hypothetical protein BWX59_02058 [Bacteroidetes bacterium ADurb.Bin028]